MVGLAVLESSKDLDDEILKRNTRNAIALFQHWGLKHAEECNLFGGISLAQLAKFKKGTTDSARFRLE